ncbi:hypothetical protein COT72_01195 [archaeon CG10_big_fil_rev_8_21_14_0_10_43_11]|nr:MAG: hypothetical protein COT72_01195 [archaeon CG10_big_fil_rev_8_21_14_0_10_43_11]
MEPQQYSAKVLLHLLDLQKDTFEHAQSSPLKSAYARYLSAVFSETNSFYKYVATSIGEKTQDLHYWIRIKDSLDFAITALSVAESGHAVLKDLSRDSRSFNRLKNNMSLEALSERTGASYASWHDVKEDIDRLIAFNYGVCAKTITDVISFSDDLYASVQSLGWDSTEALANLELLEKIELLKRRIAGQGSFVERTNFDYSRLWSLVSKNKINKENALELFDKTLTKSFNAFKRTYEKKESIFKKAIGEVEFMEEKLGHVSVLTSIIENNTGPINRYKKTFEKVIPKLAQTKPLFYAPALDLVWDMLNQTKNALFDVYTSKSQREDYGLLPLKPHDPTAGLNNDEWLAFWKFIGQSTIKTAALFCEHEHMQVTATLEGLLTIPDVIISEKQVERAKPVLCSLNSELTALANHPFFTSDTSELDDMFLSSFSKVYAMSYLVRWFKTKNAEKLPEIIEEIQREFENSLPANPKERAEHVSRVITKIHSLVDSERYGIPLEESHTMLSVLDKFALHDGDSVIEDFYTDFYSKYNKFMQKSEAYASVARKVPTLVPALKESLEQSFEAFNFEGYYEHVIADLLRMKHALEEHSTKITPNTYDKRQQDLISGEETLYSDNVEVRCWFQALSALNDITEPYSDHEIMMELSRKAKHLLDNTKETSKALDRLRTMK